MRVKDNLSKECRDAIKSLKSKEVRLDDKSGSFVVSDKNTYKEAALNDLEKQNNIAEIHSNSETDKEDIIKEIETKISEVVDEMVIKGEVLDTTAQYLKDKSKEFKVAKFYINWKCHKYEPTQVEFAHAAVRGIVSCSGTADERACDFLDFILNPGMRNLRSYLKGTKDFLIWIEKLKHQYPELPPFFSFLTMDYSAMYPSIPDNLSLPAIREYLDSRADGQPSTEQVMKLLDVVSKSNYFEFGEQLFKQTGGCSIGKKHAPPLCCLAAGKLEEDKIFISQMFKDKILNDTSSSDVKDRFFFKIY